MTGKIAGKRPGRQLDKKSSPRRVSSKAISRAAAAEQTFAKLLRIMRLMQSRMQQLEAEEGLSGAQLLALWQLSANPMLRVSDLADALHLHRSSTSNLVDKLEARGLVSRERNQQDQRIVRIDLTDKGHAVVRRVPGPMGGHLRHAIKVLPPELARQLDAGVSALLDILAAADVAPAPARGRAG